MVINTNISALTSARLLGESSSMLSKSLARLSSGSKIVNPEDDAAGLAVSYRFDAQIHRNDAANANAFFAFGEDEGNRNILARRAHRINPDGEQFKQLAGFGRGDEICGYRRPQRFGRRHPRLLRTRQIHVAPKHPFGLIAKRFE